MKRLTYNQKTFIAKYLKHGNATKAVRESYPDAKSDGGQRVQGHRLLTNANIQNEIRTAFELAELTPEYIVRQLKRIIDEGDNGEKNKALRTAAEMQGLIGKSGLIAMQMNIAPEQKKPLTYEERMVLAEKMNELVMASSGYCNLPRSNDNVNFDG